MDERTLQEVFADVPSKQLERQRLGGEGLGLLEAFVEAGLVKSNSAARNAIKQGGAYVNNRRVSDANARLTETDLASESILVLRRGKKDYALLRFL